MATTYTKSLATDFGSVLDVEQLHYEIKDDSDITAVLDGITTVDDVVDIVFQQALDGGEQTQLDTLISSHVPAAKVDYTKRIVITPKKDQFNNTNYKRVAVINYEGSRKEGVIKRVTIDGHIDSGVTDYTVRLYDHKHNQVLAENTFTNTVEDEMVLGPLANIPTTKTRLEVQL